MNRLVIVWRVTQKCNMNCLFCSYSNEVQRVRDVAEYSDVAHLIRLLGEYKNVANRDIMVSWIGGEPFLYEKMISLSQELTESSGIKVSTTTNGLMLDSKKARADVLRYFSEIVFSVDGFSKCNDRIRQYEGHFKKITKNINDLARERDASGSKLTIKVNTILLRENIENLAEFCCMLAGIGVDELTFNQLGGFDRPEFYDHNRLLTCQVERFSSELPEIKEQLSKMGLLIHGSTKYLSRILSSADDRKIPVDDCHPGEWFWFINENGYISPCSYTSYEYKLHINSLQSVEDILSVENHFRELRKAKRSLWCDDCHCTQLFDKFL